jgi:hypothetical protein
VLDCHWDCHVLDATPPAAGAATPVGSSDATPDASDDATVLVAAVVDSVAPTPRRFQLVSRLDGPLLPPRRRGLPEAGWTERGYEGVVPAEGRVALGFAAAGPPVEPPAEVVDCGRVPSDGDVPGDEPTPSELLRELGSPVPPRDAVPAPDEAAAGTRPDEAAGGPPPADADHSES